MQNAETALTDFQFRDKHGNVWDLELTYEDALRVDQIDYSNLTARKFSFVDGPNSASQDKSEAFLEAIQTPSIRTAMIFAIVMPQVKDVLGVDPEQHYERAEQTFLKGLNGKVIVESRDAFWRAIEDFFPDSRTYLGTMREKIKKASEMIANKMNQQSDLLDQAMQESVDQEFDRALKEAFAMNGDR